MAGIASMRILVSGLVSLLALGGCATVSMAPASIMVTASVSEDQSEFRETCSDFSTAVYERGLVTKRDGVSQVFNMLAFGEKMEIEDTAYRARVQIESAPASVVFKTVEADAKCTFSPSLFHSRSTRPVLTCQPASLSRAATRR